MASATHAWAVNSRNRARPASCPAPGGVRAEVTALGAVVDGSGYVYVFTGNGYTTGYDGVSNFSESVLKLNPANGLSLVDWFRSQFDCGVAPLLGPNPLLPSWEYLANNRWF